MDYDLTNSPVRWLFLNTADITNGINPNQVSISGTPYAASNSVGSVSARNTVQRWSQVDLRSVVGPEWERTYNTFGIRLMYMNMCYNQGFNSGPTNRFIRARISGLPWVNSYDVKTRGRTQSQVIINCLPVTMTDIAVNRTFMLGGMVQPASEFQILHDDPYRDITISWAQLDGSVIQFAGSFALPSMCYAFMIWPIKGKKALVEMHGFPLQKTKRLRLDDRPDPEENEE
jgi:hypothetical protein